MPEGRKSAGRRPRKKQRPKGEKNPFQKKARAAGPKKHSQLAPNNPPGGQKNAAQRPKNTLSGEKTVRSSAPMVVRLLLAEGTFLRFSETPGIL